MKKIGIIGAGKIGRALAKHLSGAGYTVLLSNSRGADTLRTTAAETGAVAASVSEAAGADVIILSVPWAKLPDAVSTVADWNNKIVIDTNNNIVSTNPFTLAELGGITTGEFVTGLLPGAQVVKAFNTIGAAALAEPAANRVIFMSGDYPNAKTVVGEIIAELRFHPIDLGSLAVGGKLQEVNAPLSGIELSKVAGLGRSAIEVVRRNTEEVQGKGNFEVFDQLFADDFVDHTTQPGFGNDKESVRQLYGAIRVAFPDFSPEIKWMIADGDKVTTYKIYHGTHLGPIFGVEATGKKVSFETVDVMCVKNGKITDHWGVANLLKLMQEITHR